MDLDSPPPFELPSSQTPSALCAVARPPLLATLPDEIILAVLGLLDVPELYALTKTSRHLRALSTDPLLHLTRLKAAKKTLNISLSHRPTLTDVQSSGRYLTRRQVAQRALVRSLTLIGLKRKLSNRPSIPALVERGVLPSSAGMAPALLRTARELEMERIKDRLRGWVVDGRPSLEDAQRGGWAVCVEDERRPGVRDMARRFARRCAAGDDERVRWGQRMVPRYDPPRAHVLSLRTHYERLGRE